MNDPNFSSLNNKLTPDSILNNITEMMTDIINNNPFTDTYATFTSSSSAPYSSSSSVPSYSSSSSAPYSSSSSVPPYSSSSSAPYSSSSVPPYSSSSSVPPYSSSSSLPPYSSSSSVPPYSSSSSSAPYSSSSSLPPYSSSSSTPPYSSSSSKPYSLSSSSTPPYSSSSSAPPHSSSSLPPHFSAVNPCDEKINKLENQIQTINNNYVNTLFDILLNNQTITQTEINNIKLQLQKGNTDYGTIVSYLENKINISKHLFTPSNTDNTFKNNNNLDNILNNKWFVPLPRPPICISDNPIVVKQNDNYSNTYSNF
jgi:hypothetical protein